MRITIKATYDIATGILVDEECYEYEGPIALCGGGPSQEQKQAAASQANLANTQANIGNQMFAQSQEQYKKIDPYATSRLNNGLPFNNALTDYAGGANAQAYAPAKAQLYRQMGAQSGLPNGFRDQALTNFNESRAQGFDQALTQNLFANEQAKNNAASQLTGQQQLAAPQSWFGGASGANSSIMQAPLQKPGLAGVLGGVAGGLASAIPF